MPHETFIDVGHSVLSKIVYPYIEAVPKITVPVQLGMNAVYVDKDDFDFYLVTSKNEKTKISDNEADIQIERFIYRLPETTLKIEVYIYSLNKDIRGEVTIPTIANETLNPNKIWIKNNLHEFNNIIPFNVYKVGKPINKYADFSIYKYNSETGKSQRIENDIDYWSVEQSGYEDLRVSGFHRYDKFIITMIYNNTQLTYTAYATPRYSSLKFELSSEADAKPWAKEDIEAMTGIALGAWFNATFIDYVGTEIKTEKHPNIYNKRFAEQDTELVFYYGLHLIPYETHAAVYSGQYHESMLAP